MTWLSIDPGETVGWALWDGEDLVEADQTPMWEFADKLYDSLVQRYGVDGFPFNEVDHFVIEDFLLYPAHVSSGPPPAWDKLRTARVIGAVELIARVRNAPVTFQGANIKPVAVKAGAENLFLEPRHENRHANDAIMHGVYYLVMQGEITQRIE